VSGRKRHDGEATGGDAAHGEASARAADARVDAHDGTEPSAVDAAGDDEARLEIDDDGSDVVAVGDDAPGLDADAISAALAGPPVPDGHRSGFAALVGRPNVGKSTLLNTLLGSKVSIVTPKPQTTRHRILGLLNRPLYQIALVDTPGIHDGHRRMLNQYMNRSATASLEDADVVVFVVEALRWTDEDERVLQRVKRANRPTVLAINKVDRAKPKSRLLPFVDEIAKRHEFAAVVPMSALKGDNLARLPDVIGGLLPEGPPMFPAEQVTDRSDRFRAAEIIREKLTMRLQEELPYGLTVEMERLEDLEDGRLAINAVIWVERPGQKAIVIGEGGALLKEVGRAARLDLNRLYGRRVHLELWVKVKENWADSAAALRSFGYEGS
jgi:GTP-binding protein Era